MKLLLVLLFVCFSLTSQAQFKFQKYFPNFLENQQFALSPSDSSYVIAGSFYFENTFYDFCVVKLNKEGHIIWSKSFPSTYDDNLSSLSISSTGDIFLGGYKSSELGAFDFFYMKLNASGDLQWNKTYGTANSEIAFYSGQTPSGDIFMAGNRDANQQPCVIKTTNSGTILWSKTFGSSIGEEEGSMAKITKDGGLIIFGILPHGKTFLTKINPNGSTAWTNSYISLHSAIPSSIKQTKDGGYIFTGSDYRCDSTGCKSYFAFIKLDDVGNVSWAKATGTLNGSGRNGMETSDGGFIFTGELKDSIYNKAVLIKTDHNGNTLWAKSYGNIDAFGEGLFIEETTDNGFALLGIEDSKTYLIKTDLNGNSGCKEKNIYPVFSNMDFSKSTPYNLPEEISHDTTMIPISTETLITFSDSLICNTTVNLNEIINAIHCSIYPNPFSESTLIDISNYPLNINDFKFSLYDVFGRKVKQIAVNDNRFIFPRGNLPQGIYFYELSNDEKILSKGKLIAE